MSAATKLRRSHRHLWSDEPCKLCSTLPPKCHELDFKRFCEVRLLQPYSSTNTCLLHAGEQLAFRTLSAQKLAQGTTNPKSSQRQGKNVHLHVDDAPCGFWTTCIFGNDASWRQARSRCPSSPGFPCGPRLPTFSGGVLGTLASIQVHVRYNNIS